MKSTFLYTLFIVILIWGCSRKTDPTPSDSIIIKSVSPNSGLIDGVETSFTVVVDYVLITKEQGELNIGFNNDSDFNSYTIIDSGTKIISKSSGAHTFEVKAKAKKWNNGDFMLFVNLSEYPHSSPWVPIVYKSSKLTFAP